MLGSAQEPCQKALLWMNEVLPPPPFGLRILWGLLWLLQGRSVRQADRVIRAESVHRCITSACDRRAPTILPDDALKNSHITLPPRLL